MKRWKKIRIMLLVYDVIVINFSFFMAFLLRFDFAFSQIPKNYLSSYVSYSPVNTLVTIILFVLLGTYHFIWKFASFNELLRISTANLLSILIHLLGISLLFEKMPISYYLIGAVLQLSLTVGIRFAYRFFYFLFHDVRRNFSEDTIKNTMLIGAGDAGRLILFDTQKSANAYYVRCIVDDNNNLWGRVLNGVPIVGGRNAILENIKKYNIDTVLFAIPSISQMEKTAILSILQETDCDIRVLPGVLPTS